MANGLFQLENIEDLDDAKIGQFLYFSALPMLLSSVRNYLLDISSYAPFSKYLLPAIDLKDLVDRKIDRNDNKEE